MPTLADDPSHPQEQLRAWIVWNAERMLGARGHAVYELIVRELQDPTPAFDELLERSMQPIMRPAMPRGGGAGREPRPSVRPAVLYQRVRPMPDLPLFAPDH